MIYLYTGTPGAGKTLFALFDISKMPDFASRPKYIAGMSYPLTPAGEALFTPTYIKPDEWTSCPDNALIFIDEAQVSMPARSNNITPPDWIQALATHRHKGLDLVLTTQSPMLLDVFVRRLVGVHHHIQRNFGLRKASDFKWESAQPDPSDYHAKKAAQVSLRSYPKQVYQWYKSAEIHTHRLSLPWKKLTLALGLIGLLVFSAWYMVHVYHRVKAHGMGLNPVQNHAPTLAPGQFPTPAHQPFLDRTGPAVSPTGYRVRGSMSMGGKTIYLAQDGKGETLVLKDCKVYEDVPFCKAGGRTVSVPGLSSGQAGQQVMQSTSSPAGPSPGQKIAGIFPGGHLQ